MVCYKPALFSTDSVATDFRVVQIGNSLIAFRVFLFARFTVVSTKLRLIALVAILAVLAAGLVEAQVVTSGGIVVPTLKQQLETGLLARTPQEQDFVAEVVALVDSGDLPLSLVQSTFLWARRKRPYPMPYFEHALKVRAAAMGIGL